MSTSRRVSDGLASNRAGDRPLRPRLAKTPRRPTLERHVVPLGLGLAATLALAAAAGAEPVGLGWTVDSVSLDGSQYFVGRLYITFDEPFNMLANVFNVDIEILGGATFNHNDAFTLGMDSSIGSWNPNNFLPGVGIPSIDSFALIGGDNGTIDNPDNATVLDPSFQASASAVNGGWFNNNPPNFQGQAQVVPQLGMLATCAGQFVIKDAGTPQSLMVKLTQTSTRRLFPPSFPQTTFEGTFAFVPAPGALAPLAMAALCGGGRRRRVGPNT